jgi:hypothetical protein
MRRSGTYNGAFDGNVENFKRRRALPPVPRDSGGSKFFDRILTMRRTAEFIFITKTVAKNR